MYVCVDCGRGIEHGKYLQSCPYYTIRMNVWTLLEYQIKNDKVMLHK